MCSYTKPLVSGMTVVTPPETPMATPTCTCNTPNFPPTGASLHHLALVTAAECAVALVGMAVTTPRFERLS